MAVALPDLRALLDVVERGRARCPLTSTALQGLGLGHLADRVDVLAGLPAETAVSRVALEAGSGPVHTSSRWGVARASRSAIATRRAAPTPVVRHLFDRAHHSVLVAGFSFDHGASILKRLWLAMRDRGVRVRIVLHVGRVGSEGHEAGVALAVTRFVGENWPFGDPTPELWYDPRTVAADSTASMHAKCVVVDESIALVGSANFTDRGQDRNLEVGVLIDDPRFAARLSEQWSRLMTSRLLVRVQ